MRVARESRWLAAICALDLATTLWFVYGMGAQEANPLMRWFLDHGAMAFVVAKTALVVGPICVLEWARRSRPQFVLRALRVGIVLYIVSYCGVVWRVNAQAKEAPDPGLTIAEIAAIESTSDHPVTPEDLRRQRASLVLIQ
jgi:hypothetical protein